MFPLCLKDIIIELGYYVLELFRLSQSGGINLILQHSRDKTMPSIKLEQNYNKNTF